jgi:hypothetical protein
MPRHGMCQDGNIGNNLDVTEDEAHEEASDGHSGRLSQWARKKREMERR